MIPSSILLKIDNQRSLSALANYEELEHYLWLLCDDESLTFYRNTELKNDGFAHFKYVCDRYGWEDMYLSLDIEDCSGPSVLCTPYQTIWF